MLSLPTLALVRLYIIAALMDDAHLQINRSARSNPSLKLPRVSLTRSHQSFVSLSLQPLLGLVLFILRPRVVGGSVG